jgi:hypothetical protein
LRITREKLIALAAQETERRAERGDVLSGYIIGSLAGGEPLLGGTADVDLVLIHRNEPFSAREMVPLSDEVHLDIVHHSQTLYQNPTQLRTDPVIGPSMCEPIFLFDPDHFFERAQAGVRGQFFRADFVHQRALNSLALARKEKALLDSNSSWLEHYLSALKYGVNSIAVLVGFPAHGRRMATQLQGQLRELEQEEIYHGFLVLLGNQETSTLPLSSWVAAWARTFDNLDTIDPELHPCRREYYLRGFQTLIEDGHSTELLWPLLDQWARVIHNLGDGNQNHDDLDIWNEAMQTLGLDPEQRPGRADALERYLDRIEEELEVWAHQSGA